MRRLLFYLHGRPFKVAIISNCILGMILKGKGVDFKMRVVMRTASNSVLFGTTINRLSLLGNNWSPIRTNQFLFKQLLKLLLDPTSLL